jgi:hypothetical protein
MLTKTKIALAAVLMLGAGSAVHAQQNKIYPGIIVRPSPNVDWNAPSASSGNARDSYAQAYVRPSPNVDRNPATKPTGAVRPLTPFERNWFDYQNHDDQ